MSSGIRKNSKAPEFLRIPLLRKLQATLPSGAAVVLVSQQHFVEIAGDGDLVVEKVIHPGALLVHGVGESRKHVAQGNGDRLWRGQAAPLRRARAVENAKPT